MRQTAATLLISVIATSPLLAHEIKATADAAVPPDFDVVSADASIDGHLATFKISVTGEAGATRPEPTGRLEGAKADAYVWPTDIDPKAVGFDAGSGILALAVTAHPDFDDTPLFDENADGDPSNDGADWHTHWVVLDKAASCAGGLAVRDITPGKDLLPATAPALPIALDSPGMSPLLSGSDLRLTVPLAVAEGAAFDGLSARLVVNEAAVAPLLCVDGTYKVISGDLSLPGVISAGK